MTAPPKRRTLVVCESKHRHPDEATARAAAMHSIERHHNVAALYVYQCAECHGWHLTRRNHGRRVRVTETNPVN